MTDRPDLAAMVQPLSRTLIDAELPVLREHGLSMWAYMVLLRLDIRPTRTQAALAHAIRADKTRIIRVLDDLQKRGLIDRVADPGDRRARLLTLTPEGRALRDAAQAAIRRKEDRLLARLPPDVRKGFVEGLIRLTGAPYDEDDG